MKPSDLHTRIESEAARELVDDLGDVENHVSGVAMLPQLAVDPQLDVQTGRVQL